MKKLYLFHKINPTFWGLFVAFSLLNILLGIILYLNRYVIGGDLIVVSLVYLIFSVYYWFIDIIREGSFEGRHTLVVQNKLKFDKKIY